MELTELYTNAKAKMEKCMTSLERDFSAVRAGRANPAVLDKVMVDYYGVPTPINQMAAISVPEARMLVIQPWDASTLKEIEKAINTSDIGINPQNDGKVIRLAFPQLTEEHRRLVVISVTGLRRKNGSLLPEYTEEEFSEATFNFVKYYVQGVHYDALVEENKKLKFELEQELEWHHRTDNN